MKEVRVEVDFMGTHHPRLDDKGRGFIPARFRAAYADGLVMTRGQEGCVYVSPAAEFQRVSQAMDAAPSSTAGMRAIRRIFRASATPAEVPDRQGRVTVPLGLRTYADLERDVVLVGNGNRMELWNSEKWDEYLETYGDAYANYSQGEEEVVIPGL